MNTERTTYVGHQVVGRDRKVIGTVSDVLYDGDELEPKWLVVKPGMLHAERYVPIEGSYISEDGEIIVPFDKKWITDAPKAGDHILTHDVEEQAAEYYGVPPDPQTHGASTPTHGASTPTHGASISRHLLLADGPVDGALVRSRLRATDTTNVAFHVIVPTRDLTAGERQMVDVENTSSDAASAPEVVAAQWRLRSAIDALRSAGFEDVTGAIGDPDPVEAVGAALDSEHFDDVVVLTKPIGISGWVHLDLPHRIERHVDQPVIHVEVADVTV